MNYRSHKKAFSLIELIIYVAVLSFMAVMVVESLAFLMRSYNSLKASEEINRNAIAVLERSVREIQQASGVDTTASVFDIHPGTLVLTTPTDPITISASDGTVYIQEGSGPLSALTQEGVVVDSLIFSHYEGTTTAEAVQVGLVLTATRNKATKTAEFHSAAVPRGSY